MKKPIALLVIALVVLMGGFLFFYRMYQHDMEALERFVSSYQRFDRAISDFSASKDDDLQSLAFDALIELSSNTHFELSSLIKNDNKIPVQAVTIADLSGRELDALVRYKREIQSNNPDLDKLAKAHDELRDQRINAYTRFLELEELKN